MQNLSGIPNETIAAMRTWFSATIVSFKSSGKKKDLLFEYLLLHDIVVKSLCAKAGSFDKFSPALQMYGLTGNTIGFVLNENPQIEQNDNETLNEYQAQENESLIPIARHDIRTQDGQNSEARADEGLNAIPISVINPDVTTVATENTSSPLRLIHLFFTTETVSTDGLHVSISIHAGLYVIISVHIFLLIPDFYYVQLLQQLKYISSSFLRQISTVYIDILSDVFFSNQHTEMASSLISNTIQVYFDSVLEMDNEGMVVMFEALISSCLSGFLGCSSAIFETALVDFFHNASVGDGVVASTIQGKPEVPQDLVLETRRAFSYDGKLVSTSCKKRELVFEFRLLNDILAKSVTVKAGSFDAVTHERFLMMTAIYGGVLVNWSKILFKVLKDMGAPDLEFGESNEFPPLKILTAKTVGKYIAINKNIVVEDVEDEPVMEKQAEKKKSVSKKRPSPTVESPVVKRKRTSGRTTPVATDLTLVTVAQEVVPIQMISDVTPPAPKRKAPKRRLQLPAGVDYWRPITRPVDSRTWELLPQRPYIDDLSPLCAFIEPVQDLDSRSPFSRVVRDIWAEVCVAVVQFSLTEVFHPVGTVNYCRDIVGPIVDIEEIPTGFRSVFQSGIDTNSFVKFLDDFVVQPVIQVLPEVESVSSDGSTVYHSPSPISKPSIVSQGEDPTASVVQIDTASADPAIQLTSNPNPDTPGSGILSQRHPDIVFNSPRTSTSSDSHLCFIADDIPQGLDDIRKDVKVQKVALSTELEDRLATVSNDLLDFQAVMTKRGKEASSPPPPPGDRGRIRGNRSGSSSSEPHRRDARYWLGGK
ncbi:hypothetical protein F511_31778 [Dorcoceras hygrometricum]|uniref:Uncharacterized protein n=1 Tax=Dorcoceras hygrometricum TaxID=472368 RepID=A0A2Z7AQJ2_9LAMI|nr:hypothetical protein F511_31778 [Dorcoceras hygrometricum]